jgi:putative acetyltransferase
MMTVLRVETPADFPGVFQVHRRAFGREAEAELVHALRGCPEFLPDLSLVAAIEETVVGHILMTDLRSEAVPQMGGLLALAPLAVLPERQRQGIGGALAREALARAAALGYAGVVVIGHPEYYRRFGFRPAAGYGLVSPFPVPDPVFMALPLREDGLEPFRGKLRYAAPFGGVE